MNRFELLNLPITFALDMNKLEAAYFSAQRQYHPDRFTNKAPEERARAAEVSAMLNDAYRTLRNPLKRAEHLLELLHVSASNEANVTTPDVGLLCEIMALQEALAEGRTPDIQGLIDDCEHELACAFENHDLSGAKSSTIRLSYLTKLPTVL